MEISGIVQYEQLFTLEILHPVTEEPTGITCMIRSAGSAEVKKVLRQQTDANLERSQKRKLIKGATLEQQEIEKAAAYIASWDWGDNTWHGKVPDDTYKAKFEVLDAEPWFFAQVAEAANTIANFTANSENP
ncbi:hypothetical protein NO932_11555 [Pelagibacterium sp. 26DY04]|uniref:hypothetical protein n=1 Tax=Pelagibacterium sp. 26DY04 TaxID=2967130 RepID=UPI002815A7EA|nr:hypothetical protein [Pelagibacterium sp. 26DY04]WMT85563.1 hypothetical protein NO932_11555 [Pelagibacterium sp. 26DY04]